VKEREREEEGGAGSGRERERERVGEGVGRGGGSWGRGGLRESGDLHSPHVSPQLRRDAARAKWVGLQRLPVTRGSTGCVSSQDARSERVRGGVSNLYRLLASSKLSPRVECMHAYPHNASTSFGFVAIKYL
jgi:hypothetical protein